ncbi:MAG: N(4)-(beta-N-acetylglucosaminyl)-L-asparaginase [Phycisphaerales bacterium JB039]
MEPICRRTFVASAAGLAAAGLLPPATARALAQPAPARGDDHRGPCVIASANGQQTVARALELITGGADCVDAVVEGVAIVEADPGDSSVGYGGLPNEDGVVQLDASVMHGPTHKAGAVACIENIMHPARVALEVLKRTDHALLVGDGARRFAVHLGFPEENLLTEESREAWLRWKAQLNPDDDWLDRDQRDLTWRDATGVLEDRPNAPVPFTWGTINCSAVDANGDLASCTTTSGLSWKIPGRVGDSPIVGAGMFCDNAVGAAGATGRGEAAIHNCAAYAICRAMEDGQSPTEACLTVLKRIADRTLQKRLRTPDGRPNFGLRFYAVRKDGAYGSATMYEGGSFAVATAEGARIERSAFLFERA